LGELGSKSCFFVFLTHWCQLVARHVYLYRCTHHLPYHSSSILCYHPLSCSLRDRRSFWYIIIPRFSAPKYRLVYPYSLLDPSDSFFFYSLALPQRRKRFFLSYMYLVIGHVVGSCDRCDQCVWPRGIFDTTSASGSPRWWNEVAVLVRCYNVDITVAKSSGVTGEAVHWRVTCNPSPPPGMEVFCARGRSCGWVLHIDIYILSRKRRDTCAGRYSRFITSAQK